jgi:hypothetical protein
MNFKTDKQIGKVCSACIGNYCNQCYTYTGKELCTCQKCRICQKELLKSEHGFCSECEIIPCDFCSEEVTCPSLDNGKIFCKHCYELREILSPDYQEIQQYYTSHLVLPYKLPNEMVEHVSSFSGIDPKKIKRYRLNCKRKQVDDYDGYGSDPGKVYYNTHCLHITFTTTKPITQIIYNLANVELNTGCAYIGQKFIKIRCESLDGKRIHPNWNLVKTDKYAKYNVEHVKLRTIFNIEKHSQTRRCLDINFNG